MDKKRAGNLPAPTSQKSLKSICLLRNHSDRKKQNVPTPHKIQSINFVFNAYKSIIAHLKEKSKRERGGAPTARTLCMRGGHPPATPPSPREKKREKKKKEKEKKKAKKKIGEKAKRPPSFFFCCEERGSFIPPFNPPPCEIAKSPKKVFARVGASAFCLSAKSPRSCSFQSLHRIVGLVARSSWGKPHRPPVGRTMWFSPLPPSAWWLFADVSVGLSPSTSTF